MSGGVRVMGIAGRMLKTRERMLGMTDGERAWRAQWLKDQQLECEPCTPEGYYKARYNVIRRFYRWPLEKLECGLMKVIGENKAIITRKFIGVSGLCIAFTYAAWYYLKYNRGDWTRKGGWKVTMSRMPVFPGDPNFPYYKETKPHEYATFGFENSPI